MSLPPDFCPYRGLQPYTEEDRRFFFGRKRDEKIIAANLYAARLTVLYGTSGVGKTSVLRAGVIPDLQSAPRTAVVFFNTWQDPGFEAALKSSVVAAVSQSAASGMRSEPATPLDELLLECVRTLRGSIFLIFDQFEEYFLYHGPSAAEDGFEAELARLVNRPDIDAHVMLSMREDELSKLDRFQGRIPSLLSNMLRLDHLDRAEAERAIREPVRVYNETPAQAHEAFEIENALVDALLSDRDLMRPTESTVRGQPAVAGQEKFETPLLQLVLTRLWHEERRAGFRALRLSTLQRLGGAKQIVDRHLETVMAHLTSAERDAAAEMFRFLVTPDNSKIAYTIPALASSAELPQEKVKRVLTRLGAPETRILRAVATPGQPPRYEIFHDVLGGAVSEWRASYVRRREWRRRVSQIAIFTALLVAAFVAFYRWMYLPWLEKQPWASLRVLSTGNVYDLRGELVVIGRSTPQFRAQISLKANDVSRLHLLITRDLLALDARSLFGTTINAQMLHYGVGRKLQPGDIVVMGGAVPMEFAKNGSAWKNTVNPSPRAWAILIDGRSRSFQYLQANPSFILTDADNRLIVQETRSAAALLKVVVTTAKGSYPVITIEDSPDAAELHAKWKYSDYEYAEETLPADKPVMKFWKKDIPEYCIVEQVAFSYGDLPFQIVQLHDVESGGTIAHRTSASR
jgi:hypothetical protein